MVTVGTDEPVAVAAMSCGADLDWLPHWENVTPLDAARREGADDLVAWLRERGARSASELPR